MKKRISKDKLYILVIIIPFLLPDFSHMVIKVDIFINFIKVFASIVMLLRIFIEKRMRIIVDSSWLLLFCALYIGTTMINSPENVRVAVVNAGTIFFMSLAISECMRIDDKGFISLSYILLLYLCILNTASVILFPSGFGQTSNSDGYMYFWGYDNGFIWWDIILISLFLMKYEFIEKKKTYKRKMIVLFLIMGIPIFFRQVGGGMAILILYALYFMLRGIVFKNKEVHSTKWVWGIIAGGLIVIFFRIQRLISWFIVLVLHKNIGLSGRYNIWEVAIPLIKEKIWFGHGAEVGYILRTSTWLSVNHCHNFILNTVYVVGLMGTGIFLIYLNSVLRKINKMENGVRGILILGLTMMFLSLITESQKQMIQLVFMMQFALKCRLRKVEYET